MATVAESPRLDTHDWLPSDRFGLVTVPTSAHTYDGFLDWVLSGELPEKLRVTFLAGEVMLDMTEENIGTHAQVKAEVCRVLMNLVREGDWGQFYLDGVRIGNRPAAVSNNPDAVAFRWSTLEAGRVIFVERKGQRLAVEGTPDFVLEIVSTSSVGKDKKKLFKAYHDAGVQEYWLIDARGNGIEFSVFDWQTDGYVATAVNDGWIASKVFEHQFRLTRQEDRLGTWRYTLDARKKGPKSKAGKKS